MQLSQLSYGNNAQEVPGCGIGWINQADPNRLIHTRLEVEVAQSKAFTGAQANMNISHLLSCLDPDGTAKGCERFLAGHDWVAHDQLMVTMSSQVEIHIEPDPIGAHIVEG